MNDDLTPWQRQTLRLAAYQLAPDDATAGAMRDIYARFALAFEEWLSEGYKTGKAEAKAMQAGYPEAARTPYRED